MILKKDLLYTTRPFPYFIRTPIEHFFVHQLSVFFVHIHRDIPAVSLKLWRNFKNFFSTFLLTHGTNIIITVFGYIMTYDLWNILQLLETFCYCFPTTWMVTKICCVGNQPLILLKKSCRYVTWIKYLSCLPINLINLYCE